MKKAILMAVLPLALLAQDKMGYVHMERLFDGYYKTVNAAVLMEQKGRDFQEKMEILKKDLESAMKEVKQAEDDAKNELLSKTAQEQALAKFRAQMEIFTGRREEFERTRAQGMADLRNLQLSTAENLGKELQAFVKKYAHDKGYTHIWDVSGNTTNRLPMLLVYPEKQCNLMTDELIQLSNAGHEKELADAKKKLEAMRKK